MNNLFIIYKMAIKTTESALKRRVGQVSGNTGIFLGLTKNCVITNHVIKRFRCMCILL